MVLPGSKGWIKKYFDMVDKGQIELNNELPKNIERDSFIHAALGRTGRFHYSHKQVGQDVCELAVVTVCTEQA